MSLLPALPPTRPLLIWAVLALACAVVLSVEGVLLLSGRTRHLPGWRFGVLLLLGSLVAAALSARLYDIHGELLRGACNCQPFQWTAPDLATPLVIGALLSSAVLAFTVYGGVRTRRFVRSSSAAGDDGRAASEWPFSGDLFVLALMMDAGIWTLVFVLPRLVEAAAYRKSYMPSGDGLGIPPLIPAVASTVCSALLLIVPLTILLRALVSHESRQRPA
jgi:hypothetical protein